jgi:acid phosphatase (class A)
LIFVTGSIVNEVQTAGAQLAKVKTRARIRNWAERSASMFIETARTVALMGLAAALAAGCATVVAPTSPADLPQGRPGYVIGYLQPAQLPDSQALLPPPPAAASAALAADEDAYRSTRKLRDTPRWSLAVKDADLNFPRAAETFSCALAMPISEEATPHLNMLLRRVRADASRANDKAKDYYKRRRPFAVYGDSNCTPREQLKDDSYPSGHSSIGWASALTLAEIAPDRVDAILARGLAFGQSRVVCGVHWKSDVEAGRVIGASVVSRLHADRVFAAQLAGARKEIEKARAAGLKSPLDCAAEAQALASRP